MKQRAIFITMVLATVTSLLVACGEGSKRSKGDVNGYCASGVVGCTYPGYPGYPGNGGYNYGYGKAWTGNLAITNSTLYKSLLKAYGFCGQYLFGNWLDANCSNWDNQGSVQFEVYGTTLPAQGKITIYATYDQYGQYVRPIELVGQVLATSTGPGGTANSGFELRTTALNKLFSAVANVGSIVANNQYVNGFRLQFSYNGQGIGYSDVYLRW